MFKMNFTGRHRIEKGGEPVSQMTSRCENTVNTNIKRLTALCFAKTTLEKGLAAFKQIFWARKPRSLLAPVHSKSP